MGFIDKELIQGKKRSIQIIYILNKRCERIFLSKSHLLQNERIHYTSGSYYFKKRTHTYFSWNSKYKYHLVFCKGKVNHTASHLESKTLDGRI